MSQKYDILPMAFKYDITPQQFLFRPSSSANTNIPFARPPTYIPMASTAEEPAASTVAKTLHRVPSPLRPSTDSDTESLLSANARLIYPTSHHIPQKDYTFTVYPTTILRLIAGILFVIAIPLYVRSIVERAIAALVFIPLAILRILFVFAFHTPRNARWRGLRGANALVDFTLVAGICGSVAQAFVNEHSYYWGPSPPSNLGACILGWIGCGLLAVAAVDTGRPSRIAVTTTVDCWTENALSLDNWDAERQEMGRSASSLV
ncbi:hypothetical protein VE03_09793 [Pseudogymnoascus sp. 23342-1-I1]|nr:hypothetical protein VE03_09793 [Pseudogymnoascus sp. 23342-1-I1]